MIENTRFGEALFSFIMSREGEGFERRRREGAESGSRKIAAAIYA
jgi:hypothetical protein